MHAAHHTHVKYKGAEFHLHDFQNTHNVILELIFFRPPLISMTTAHVEANHNHCLVLRQSRFHPGKKTKNIYKK